MEPNIPPLTLLVRRMEVNCNMKIHNNGSTSFSLFLLLVSTVRNINKLMEVAVEQDLEEYTSAMVASTKSDVTP